MRPLMVALVAGGVVLFAVQPAGAKHRQTTGGRPGLGVGGVGVSTAFVSVPVVAAPEVRAAGITTPAIAGTPGVNARSVEASPVSGTPGVSARSVATQGIDGTPGAATKAPGVAALPRGYYTTIPATAVQTIHHGETCYYAAGVYYRPEYYLGSLVYVAIP
jgi:hypothetical protein